jgi:glycosyltransferase involved in cell wall biosynthesis
MNILLCSKARLRSDLGTSQTLIDLGDALCARGHNVRCVDPYILARFGHDPSEALDNFLTSASTPYDVVDFDYSFYKPLGDRHAAAFIARVQLLGLHELDIEIPPLPKLRFRIKHLVTKRYRRKQHLARANHSLGVFDNSTYTIVLNDWDKQVLVDNGINRESIAVIPNGIGRKAKVLFDVKISRCMYKPKIAFIGSFGPRKGAADMPAIVARTVEKIPDARFLLLGTLGIFRTREEVLSMFPRRHRGYIDVVPSFERENLPALLESCTIGIYPTYWEAFGLGALEMMAAALPVISYRAPGPCSFIPEPWVVPLGDVDALVGRLVSLLQSPVKFEAAQRLAREVARRHTWERSAALTEIVYQEAFQGLTARP